MMIVTNESPLKRMGPKPVMDERRKVTLYLDKTTWDRLESLADGKGVTVSAYLRKLVQRAVRPR